MSLQEKIGVEFSVASYESDLNGRMSLFSLFNRFQELAGIHAEKLRVGYDALRESDLGWILSRIKLNILSMPGWGEDVQLYTWPKRIDRLFALRDFSLQDANGQSLVLATSAWLLIDVKTNRPKRIETLPINLQFPGAPDAVPETPDKIQMPDNMSAVFEKPVWLSDIDTNQHVNNAQYAKWIGDCFPAEQFKSRRISSLQINFLEETLPGDTVELLKSPAENTSEEYFICGRSMNKNSVNFHSRVAWE